MDIWVNSNFLLLKTLPQRTFFGVSPCCTCVKVSLGYKPRSGMEGNRPWAFSTVLNIEYRRVTLQSSYTSWHPYHWLWVSFSPLTLDVSKLLKFCQFYDYEISSGYFNSLNISKIEHLFICLLTIWTSFSVKFLLVSSAHYSVWLFAFIFWLVGVSYPGCLPILLLKTYVASRSSAMPWQLIQINYGDSYTQAFLGAPKVNLKNLCNSYHKQFLGLGIRCSGEPINDGEKGRTYRFDEKALEDHCVISGVHS